MRQGLRWIGWIGWALASVVLPFFAARTIATVWAVFSWPLAAGPQSLYPVSFAQDSEALASHWMTWSRIGWTTALLIVFASIFTFGAVRLLANAGLRRRFLAVLTIIFVSGMTTYGASELIRSDPYWDVFITVPT